MTLSRRIFGFCGLLSCVLTLAVVGCAAPTTTSERPSRSQKNAATNKNNASSSANGESPGQDTPSDLCEENSSLSLTKMVNGTAKDWCVDVYEPRHEADGCLDLDARWVQVTVSRIETSSMTNDEITYAYVTLAFIKENLVAGTTWTFRERTESDPADLFEQVIERSDGKKAEFAEGISWTNESAFAAWSEGTIKVVSVPSARCEHFKLKIDFASFWRSIDEDQTVKHPAGRMTGDVEFW